MRRFTAFSLYCYTGSKEDAPEGFTESPPLVDYLNYLEEQGYTVFQVVHQGDAMWYTILCVSEVTNANSS